MPEPDAAALSRRLAALGEPDVATLTHRLAALTRRKIGQRMALENWAHDAGFRPGCVGVLRVVAAREPVSQREVSEALLLDPSDVVTFVDILERAGLVERRRDPADRRRYALEVTPRGQLAVVRLREISRETNEDLLAPLNEAERAQLADLIARVVDHHIGHRVDEDAVAAADEGRPREVPVMPGHPERAPEPYDPNREAARAHGAETARR
jgi:DNA-binding MarR family transcriptional regulator